MAIAEKPEHHAELDASSPTTLHLFRPNQKERPALRSIAYSVEQFANNAKGTYEFLEKLGSAGVRQINRLSQAEKELDQQIFNLNSSATCGTVFLKMQEELPHLSPPELMDFFRLCLRINMKVEGVAGEITTANSLELALKKALINANNLRNNSLKVNTTIDSMAGDPPAWLKDSKKSWSQFLREHSAFILYLNPKFTPNLSSAYSQITFGKLRDDGLGHIISGEYPDWLDDNQPIITKETVQQELDEDLNEVKKIFQEKERIKHQKEYIKKNFTQKSEKAQQWYETQAQRLFPKIGNVNFLDLVLVLYLLSNTKRPIEEMIQKFSRDKDLASNPEPVALFLEKTMKESGITIDTQTSIDSDFTNKFEQLFSSMHEQSEEFQKLREKNKKVFKSLNYDIKPLLEIMTADEISYLRELLEEYKGYPVEPFIWSIAENASSHFKKEENKDKEKLKTKVIQSLRQPTASLLRNNWKWAFDQFKESLSSPDVQFSRLSPAETSDQIETADFSSAPEVQRELTSSIKEIQEGNLSGWTILYTTNRSTDPKHLVKIGGTTFDEREEELEKFFVKEGVGHSIKTESIAHVLDGLPVFPEEFRRTRSRQTINGVEFGKTKRGKGRIFDIVDSEKKIIIFFYYQKNAWSYRF